MDPASRTVYEAGELAQCDLWFPPVDVPLGFGQVGRPPVLVMVAGYSRWIAARMLPSRSAADLIAGHWRLLVELGAVPRALVWDNEGAVGSWRAGGPRLTEPFAAFAGLLGVKFVLCKPRDPEAKPRASYCSPSGRFDRYWGWWGIRCCRAGGLPDY